MNKKYSALGFLVMLCIIAYSPAILEASAATSDTNLMAAPNGFVLTYGSGTQIIFQDTAVVKTTGIPSIRLERHTSSDINIAREINGRWLTVKPGDHIVAKCWIKTDSTTYSGTDTQYAGARIGIDLCAPRGDGTIAIVDSYPHNGAEHINGIVRWGTTTWTLKTWDITIPTTYYTTETNGTPLKTPAQITKFVLWGQACPATFAGKAWFTDTELYINPTVTPTTTPTPTPTPTATPTPTPAPTQNNLMANGFSLTYGSGTQIIFQDTTVVKTTGKPSIRLDPHTPNDINTGRAMTGKWLTVKPGDHIVAKCWIKTDSTTYSGTDTQYAGARIGIDLFAPRGDGTIALVDSYPHNGAEHINSIVRWGTTTWTLKTWDITIPTTYYTTETNGTPLKTPAQITQFVLWAQASPATFAGKAWFTDTELYINPTVTPTTTPTPTPTPTATPTPTPAPTQNNLMANGFSLTYGSGTQIIFQDTTVVKTTGKPSIRLDPHTPNDINTGRAMTGKWLTVKPGDHIVAKCWIKTDSTTYSGTDTQYAGARIGIDLFAPRGDGTIALVDSYPHNGAEHINSIVRWGTTTWTLKTWDITIPTTYYTTETNGTPLKTPAQITQFVLWAQASPATFAGKAWFTDTELYINP